MAAIVEEANNCESAKNCESGSRRPMRGMSHEPRKRKEILSSLTLVAAGPPSLPLCRHATWWRWHKYPKIDCPLRRAGPSYAFCPLLTFFANELDPVRMVIIMRPFCSPTFGWTKVGTTYLHLTQNPPFPRKLINVRVRPSTLTEGKG